MSNERPFPSFTYTSNLIPCEMKSVLSDFSAAGFSILSILRFRRISMRCFQTSGLSSRTLQKMKLSASVSRSHF